MKKSLVERIMVSQEKKYEMFSRWFFWYLKHSIAFHNTVVKHIIISNFTKFDDNIKKYKFFKNLNYILLYSSNNSNNTEILLLKLITTR